jgi:beta-galactosidase/beta-glucuronidase
MSLPGDTPVDLELSLDEPFGPLTSQLRLRVRSKNHSPTSSQPMKDAYPRPQLQRDAWICLNGPWRFAFDTQATGRLPGPEPEWSMQIQVPFSPECERSGICDQSYHHACWYQRDFELTPGGGRVLMHFGAVDYFARVWINGELAIEHEGGHTPFSVDITQLLDESGVQRVTVWVEDDPHDLEKPRGKQDWRPEPHAIWYPRTTGIWQTVWMEVVADSYVAALKWVPNVDGWEISLSAFTGGTPRDDLRLAVRLSVGDRVLAEDTYAVVGGEVHRRIGLSDPGIDDYRNELLWSPEKPTLIEAHVRLLRGDEVVDRLRSYTALRSIGVQREKILLNGRPYALRLVLDQGYWPDSLLSAPSDDALRLDVELAKRMGFNGVRKHQKIEDPRYLYWADRLGLLVFTEMPSAYRFTGRAIKRLLQEWTAAIDRDISHPCIIIWVPFNESWGVPGLTTQAAPRDAVAAFYHLTKTLDPSRLVIGNDGWESSATDIIGIHDYDCDPVHMRVRYGPEVKVQEVVDRRWSGGRILTLDGYPHRGQPICLSEFGGVAYSQRIERPESWGYTYAKSLEEFTALACGVIEAARTTAMFSGFCYTQFADTFQETNGLLYSDRTPKLPLEVIAAAVRGTRD